MSERPTIYLSNWASARSPGHHGPGRKLTIMCYPRAWEHGTGSVCDLLPSYPDLLAARTGAITMAEYRSRYERGLYLPYLRPGSLWSTAEGGGHVRDGDTLCCTCARAEAAAGRCHRSWMAPYLRSAGWRVILDGVEVAP